jgi:hypothetical protein
LPAINKVHLSLQVTFNFSFVYISTNIELILKHLPEKITCNKNLNSSWIKLKYGTKESKCFNITNTTFLYIPSPTSDPVYTKHQTVHLGRKTVKYQTTIPAL